MYHVPTLILLSPDHHTFVYTMTYNMLRFEEGAFQDLVLHEKHFKAPVSAIPLANLCGRRTRQTIGRVIWRLGYS